MSIVKVNRIEQAGNTNLPTNLLPVTANAWVNFNGQGTVAIRDSHNVSSVTDSGVGNYTVNLENPLSNSNYGVIVSSGNDGVSTSTSVLNVYSIGTGSYSFTTVNIGGTSLDRSIVSAVSFGGQS